MNEQILNLLSCCFRYILYHHVMLGFCLYLVYRACGVQRFNLGVFITVIELRMFIAVLVTEVLAVFCGRENWYPFLLGLTGLFHALVSIYLASCFRGHLGKTFMTSILMETFAVGCIMGAYALAYWDTGKVYTMTGQPFSPRDGLVILFYLPLCAVCVLALSPVLRFYRNYSFKHPRLLLCLALIGMFERMYINILSSLPYGTYHLTADLFLGTLVVLFLASVWRKRAGLQKQLYAQQMRLTETHFALLREKTTWVMDSRTQLEQQISLMESLPQKGQTEKIRSYLEELKAQYTAILEKNRCNDLLVDALLSYQEIVCRQHNISTEFSLQQYGRGNLEEQEVVVLLLLLFNRAIQSCKKTRIPGRISLSMALLKGQFFLELSYSGKQKLAKDGIRPILKRHDGMFSQKRTDDGWRAEVLLAANSAPQ